MLFRRYWLLAFCVTLLSVSPIRAQAPEPTVVEAEMESQFDFRCTVKRKDAGGTATPASVLLGLNPDAAHLAITLAGDTLTLARITKGQARSLATVRQFYAPPTPHGVPLVLQWRDGGLRVIYDGRTVLRREGLEELSGAVAIAAAGSNLEFVDPLCQPVEPVHFADDFMRNAGETGQWETLAGAWKVRSAADPAKVANAFTYVAQGKPAVAVTGRWFWDDYQIGGAVRPSGQGAIGLVAYWQDANNYFLFKWLSEDEQRWRGKEKQLWRIWRGEPTLIAAAPGGYRPKQWYRLTLAAGGGLFNVAVDGQQILHKRSDLFGQGKAGLYCDGDPEALFDDVQVDTVTSETRLDVVRCEAILPQFTKEQSMENWASPKGEWLPATDAREPAFWNRGAFFGDYALELKATALEPGRARVTALVGGDGASPASGYALVVSQAAGKARVEVTLQRAGKAVTLPRSVSYDAATGCALRIERAGRVVRGYIGKEMVASYLDAKPLAGRRAGYTVQGATVPPGEARMSGGNFYDYTFYRAPTDWTVSGGTWDMTSRWDCSPNWSWYGGWSDRIAAIWNKHSFSGDFVVEVYAACKRDTGGYKHPRDINITVTGDGRDLASGYSCIFGGWNNTSTRILRGGKTVAETSQVLLPKDYQGQAHHKWFCLRVEKTGDTVAFYVDRKLALQYKDPAPLSGRRIALWTRGNGVMIARATIYYAQEVETPPLPTLVSADEGLRPVPAERIEKLLWKARDKDTTMRLEAVTAASTGAATPARPAVRAVNLEGGGPFASIAEIEPFDALKTSRLSFDCRLATGTEVNLYLKVKGVPHSVYLTGPAKELELEGTKVLGAATGVRADGQWHTVSLDLAALLKPLYPNDAEIKVEEVFLGNLTRDTYAQAGFGANYPGTNYLVRAFTLRSNDNLLAKLIEPQLRAPSSPAQTGAPTPKLAAIPPITVTPEAPKSPEALRLARGMFNLKATYCQDADAGEFKAETLNKPISWESFSRRIFTKTVDTIDFDWGDKSPGEGIRAKYWSARFLGKLAVPEAGDYVFHLDRLDDGGRIYIDGELVLDSWLVQPAASHASKPIRLTAGVHEIRLDFCQGTGPGSLTLAWSGPSFAKEVIPRTVQPEVIAPAKVAGVR